MVWYNAVPAATIAASAASAATAAAACLLPTALLALFLPLLLAPFSRLPCVLWLSCSVLVPAADDGLVAVDDANDNDDDDVAVVDSGLGLGLGIVDGSLVRSRPPYFLDK